MTDDKEPDILDAWVDHYEKLETDGESHVTELKRSLLDKPFELYERLRAWKIEATFNGLKLTLRVWKDKR